MGLAVRRRRQRKNAPRIRSAPIAAPNAIPTFAPVERDFLFAGDTLAKAAADAVGGEGAGTVVATEVMLERTELPDEMLERLVVVLAAANVFELGVIESVIDEVDMVGLIVDEADRRESIVGEVGMAGLNVGELGIAGLNEETIDESELPVVAERRDSKSKELGLGLGCCGWSAAPCAIAIPIAPELNRRLHITRNIAQY